MNRFFTISLLATLLTSSMAFAQITDDPDDRRANGRDQLKTTTPEGKPLSFTERLRFGGGIGPFAFGNGAIQLGISPVIAYNTTEHLILGVGLSYIYTRYSYFPATTYTQVGVRGFAMYEVVPEIVPHLYANAELQTTSVSTKIDGYGAIPTQSYTSPLIGVTYMQPFSRRFGLNISVLYNLAYSSTAGSLSNTLNNNSPLVFRVSFF